MKLTTIFTLSLIALLTAGSAKADYLVESYIAHISNADKYNSRGERLTSPAAILRQDRANVHVFGKASSLDDYDGFFDSIENRALLERLLERGCASPGAAELIVYGNPLALVEIYRSDEGYFYIRVGLAE